MTGDWERVTDLFAAARSLTPSSRTAFLDAIGVGEPDLRSQIESLLAADAIDDGFLSRPPAALVSAALQQVTDLAIDGQVLKERYLVQEQLASGGQALVYRAHDRLLARPVVIKVMRAGHQHNSVLRARFEEEMKALARIEHPAVVGILDVGALDDGSPFLVLQFIEGASLRDLLQHGPIERRRAIEIVQAIATALSSAHAAGVAHYDLKPENVMVQRLPDGTEAVKLIDFGIAKIDQSGAPPVQTTIVIAGSVRYMAPEQLEGRNEPASDVYALGLLACEVLFGHPDLRAVQSPVDRNIARLIERAVAFYVHDRPSDVRAWAAQLADAAAAADRRPRRARTVAMAAATVLVAAVAGFFASSRGEGAVDRIIEKVGAFDPVHEGFQIHGALAGTVIPNAARSALIGWNVKSDEAGGGYYFRPLSARQKRAALARGWALSATMRATDGGASAAVDFGSDGPRFDINLMAESDGYVVRLNTQLVPTFEGLVLRLPRDDTAFHKFDLRFDPSLGTADLWIDGEKRLTGYRGHRQFQDNAVGVLFGAAPINSEIGSGSFLGIRFEINP